MTEQYLNSQNKATLIGLVLTLNTDLENYKSGPLKSSDVEKKVLELAKQVTDVKAQEADRRRQHEEALVKLDNDKELAKRKLELEFESSRGISEDSLAGTYKDLEERSKINIDDLSFGLKKAEIEVDQKLEAVNAKLVEAETSFEEKKASITKETEDLKAKAIAEKTAIAVAHTREMEEIGYNNKIALRDENLGAATKIAAKHNAIIIDNDELEALKAVESINEETIKSAVGKAEGIMSSRMKREHEMAFKDAENKATLDKSLLEKDKEYLQKNLTDAQARILELTAQIKEFPNQLKAAVEAAKADISISQDATGKK